MTRFTRSRPALAGVAVLLAAGLLYLLTLDNGLRPDELTGGDLITHQYAQVEARPSNAPGYPLYTMGGWLWFHLARAALGWALNPIQILSIYSTLWGLASLALLYLILLRVAGGQWPAAMLLTAFHAATFFFWYYSVTTEQYTSAVFQTLLVIWLAFKWDDNPRDSTLLWLAVASGTMLANMVTTLFILPPLLWFIFSRADASGQSMFLRYLKRPKFVVRAVGLALLPLLSYAYIYIRGAQHPEWRGAGEWPSAWDWFVQFITIQQGRDELAPGLSLHAIFTDEFPWLMAWEMTWPVFLGGLLGLAALRRRRAMFLYGTLTIYLLFCWGYRYGNWFQVIIPAYPIFTIGFAASLRRISEWRSPTLAAPSPLSRFFSRLPPLPSLLILLLALLLVYRLGSNLPQANQRNRPADTGLDPGWAILADRPAAPAVIAGVFEERVALDYLTTVWKVMPDITPTGPETFDAPAANAGPTHYVTRQAAAAAPEMIQPGVNYPQAAGQQLIVLRTQPLAGLPSTARPLSLNFGDVLQLVGWEQVSVEAGLPSDALRRLDRANWQLALYWRAAKRPTANYTISVRPLVAGQLIVRGEETIIQDHRPVWGVYPTRWWAPGEQVRDVYALHMPEGTTPDAVQIVVYRTTADGFENLAEQTISLSP